MALRYHSEDFDSCRITVCYTRLTSQELAHVHLAVSSWQTSGGLLVNINIQLSVITLESQIAVSRKSLSLQIWLWEISPRFLMTIIHPEKPELDKSLRKNSEVMVCRHCVCFYVEQFDKLCVLLSFPWRAPTQILQNCVFGAKPPPSIIHCSVFMFDWSLTAVSLAYRKPTV